MLWLFRWSWRFSWVQNEMSCGFESSLGWEIFSLHYKFSIIFSSWRLTFFSVFTRKNFISVRIHALFDFSFNFQTLIIEKCEIRADNFENSVNNFCTLKIIILYVSTFNIIQYWISTSTYISTFSFRTLIFMTYLNFRILS